MLGLIDQTNIYLLLYCVIFGWQREKCATNRSGSLKIWTRTNCILSWYPAPHPCMENIGPGMAGFMIDDRCRCGRHVNIHKYLDILLIIMLSQSILIRPLKSLIGVNKWRRCDTRVNVDVMSWMASICRTLRSLEFKKIRDLLPLYEPSWKMILCRVWLKLMRLQTHVFLLRHSHPRDERQRNKEYFVDLLVIAEIKPPHGWQFEVQFITNQVNYRIEH